MEWRMARNPRFTLPGVPQHVVQRGNNRVPCFFAPQDHHLSDSSLSAFFLSGQGA